MAVRSAGRRPQTLQKPFSFPGGFDGTTPEHLTPPTVICDGENVYTDANGEAYDRGGNRFLGGPFSALPSFGLFRFRDDPTGIEEQVAVNGDDLYRFDGQRFVKFTTVTMPARNPVSGVYFPDANAFYLTNGTDAVVKLTRTGGTLVATTTTVTVSRYLGYHDNCLLFLGLPGRPDQFGISDRTKDTFTQGSVIDSYGNRVQSNVTCDGNVLGFANLDMLSGVVVTDRRGYRITGVSKATDSQNGTVIYKPTSFLDLGKARCVAPFSISTAGGAAFWLGYDESNGMGIYRTDGQSILEIGSYKYRRILRKIDPAQALNACSYEFGSYYRLAVPYSGETGNRHELHIDTRRSDFSAALSYQGMASQPVMEAPHSPGFEVSRYATYRTGNQEYCLAVQSDLGCVYRMGAGNGDESVSQGSLVSDSLAPVSPSVSQAFTADGTESGLAVVVKVSSPTTGPLQVSYQTDVGGHPSGVLVSSVFLPASSAGTAPKAAYVSLPPNLASGKRYHAVFSEPSGNWSVGLSANAYPERAGTFTTGVWDGLTEPLAVSISVLKPVSSYLVQTTSLAAELAKKKTTQMLFSGQTSDDVTLQVGIGGEGRDGQFAYKPVDLTGGRAVWASADADPTANALHWAADPNNPGTYERWASLASDYVKTVWAPLYVSPAFYVSYRITGSGYSGWRLNSYLPSFDVLPTSLS